MPVQRRTLVRPRSAARPGASLRGAFLRGAFLRGAFLLAAALVAGCAGPFAAPTPLVGSGEPRTEDRTTGEVRAIRVDGPVHLVVATGTEPRVSVQAPPNLLPLLDTDLRDGELAVGVLAPGIDAGERVVITVIAPRLRSLALAGVATAVLEHMAADLRLELSGGATVRAIGRLPGLELVAGGGSRAELGELLADEVRVTLDGGAGAEVRATRSVTGSVVGGASLRVDGQPAVLEVTTDGGGSLSEG